MYTVYKVYGVGLSTCNIATEPCCAHCATKSLDPPLPEISPQPCSCGCTGDPTITAFADKAASAPVKCTPCGESASSALLSDEDASYTFTVKEQSDRNIFFLEDFAPRPIDEFAFIALLNVTSLTLARKEAVIVSNKYVAASSLIRLWGAHMMNISLSWTLVLLTTLSVIAVK